MTADASSFLPDADALHALVARERDRYSLMRPRCRTAHDQSKRHWLNGVPMHWMTDWDLPFPLVVAHAHGATLTDLDGHSIADFCLGDTGAMFGHSPAPVADALRRRADMGLTYMLPSDESAIAGELLAQRFKLPYWQLTQTASDANRAILRWARAITGRSKILIFDGAYHGMVDETFVRLSDTGEPVARGGQIGRVIDHTSLTRVVEFNDLDALRAELATEEIACLLAEPVMTNAGMVLPQDGFWPRVRQLCTEHGTLLAFDETHTLSSGPGGHARRINLLPDVLTLGKAIAGGVACGAFGFTTHVQARMLDVLRTKGAGHSGMGTTLAANALSTAALVACLRDVMTENNYRHMLMLADVLASGLRHQIAREGKPWHVAQVGARLELSFRSAPPRTARESLAASQPDLDLALHLYLLNRGALITPFHNMMLISPATTREDVSRLLDCFDAFLSELRT